MKSHWVEQIISVVVRGKVLYWKSNDEVVLLSELRCGSSKVYHTDSKSKTMILFLHIWKRDRKHQFLEKENLFSTVLQYKKYWFGLFTMESDVLTQKHLFCLVGKDLDGISNRSMNIFFHYWHESRPCCSTTLSNYLCIQAIEISHWYQLHLHSEYVIHSVLTSQWKLNT